MNLDHIFSLVEVVNDPQAPCFARVESCRFGRQTPNQRHKSDPPEIDSRMHARISFYGSIYVSTRVHKVRLSFTSNITISLDIFLFLYLVV